MSSHIGVSSLAGQTNLKHEFGVHRAEARKDCNDAKKMSDNLLAEIEKDEARWKSFEDEEKLKNRKITLLKKGCISLSAFLLASVIFNIALPIIYCVTLSATAYVAIVISATVASSMLSGFGAGFGVQAVVEYIRKNQL